MSIVDREVIGEGYSDGYSIPELSLGNFVENIFRKNIEAKGDGNWLVKHFHFEISVAKKLVSINCIPDGCLDGKVHDLQPTSDVYELGGVGIAEKRIPKWRQLRRYQFQLC